MPTTARQRKVQARLGGLGPAVGPAWGGLLATHATLTRAMNRDLEQAHGLPLRSYDVLRQIALAPEGKLRMADLAERVMLSRPGLTGVIHRLADQGLIERSPDPDDGRGALASLTPRGEERLLQAHPTHVASIQDRFASQLTDDELRALAAIWAKLAAS